MAVVTPQQRLREVRDELSRLAGKGADWSSDDSTSFESLVAEGESLKGQIGQLGRFDDLKGWMDQSAGGLPIASTEAGATVFETSPGARGSTKIQMLDQWGPGIASNKAFRATATDEYERAIKSYIQHGERGLSNAELKTLQEGQDSEGGFLVPIDFLNRIIQKEPTPTRIAGRTTMLNTSRDTMVIPRVNYTAGPTDDPNNLIYTTGIRSTWTGEVPASSTAARITDPVYGQTRVPIYTNMLSAPLTLDMVEDASFDVMGWLSSKFGETIDLLRDNMILNGNGRGQPTGLLNAPGADATQPPVVNLGNPITADGLVGLAFALPEQYDSNAVMVFSKTQTGPTIAKLKDSNGRYLWGAGLQDSGLMPDIHGRRLLGYEVLFSEFAQPVGANKFPVAFGDFAGYYLVNRVGLSIRVLNELYAETNQVLVLGRVRFGGQPAEAWRFQIGKQA